MMVRSRAVPSAPVLPPHAVEQLRVRQQPSGALRQQAQHFVLGRGQTRVAAGQGRAGAREYFSQNGVGVEARIDVLHRRAQGE